MSLFNVGDIVKADFGLARRYCRVEAVRQKSRKPLILRPMYEVDGGIWAAHTVTHDVYGVCPVEPEIVAALPPCPWQLGLENPQ